MNGEEEGVRNPDLVTRGRVEKNGVMRGEVEVDEPRWAPIKDDAGDLG